MKKKLVAVILTALMLSMPLQARVGIVINNNMISGNVAPITVEGKTLVPMRAISENIGAKMTWDSHTKSFVIAYHGTTIKGYANQSEVTVNGVEKQIDDNQNVVVKQVNGSLYVPIRFIAEALECNVSYSNGIVYITTDGGNTKEETNTDKVYQVSLLQALTKGEYDGVISVEQLKEHGDIGIGTFTGVNGELIMLDGVVYQALHDGTVVEATDDEGIPFSTVGYFANDESVKQQEIKDLDELKQKLNTIVDKNGKNQYYFIKTTSKFDEILVRSEVKQEKPYRPLDEVLKKDQREFTYSNISGTIVAVYFPDYMKGVNTPGWHFHFISDDKSKGGHVLGISNMSGDIYLSEMSQFEMICPDNDTFNKQMLAEDQSERIKSVEQK